MKTKEEILISYGKAYEYHHSTQVCPLKAAHDAMDEHAKQVALTFDRWKRTNIYTIDEDGETYHKLIIDGDNAWTEQHSFDQVYAQFIESQNKPTII